MPASPIPKSMATPELLGYIATAKFCGALLLYLPLYRQEKQFARIGVDLTRQTTARWMMRLARLATPLINLRMDEARFPVLKEPDEAATSPSQLWVQRGWTWSSP